MEQPPPPPLCGATPSTGLGLVRCAQACRERGPRLLHSLMASKLPMQMSFAECVLVATAQAILWGPKGSGCLGSPPVWPSNCSSSSSSSGHAAVLVPGSALGPCTVVLLAPPIPRRRSPCSHWPHSAGLLPSRPQFESVHYNIVKGRMHRTNFPVIRGTHALGRVYHNGPVTPVCRLMYVHTVAMGKAPGGQRPMKAHVV